MKFLQYLPTTKSVDSIHIPKTLITSPINAKYKTKPSEFIFSLLTKTFAHNPAIICVQPRYQLNKPESHCQLLF